jgi:hypothetical protein
MSSAGHAPGVPDVSDQSELSGSLLKPSRKGIKCGAPRTKAYCMEECIAITRAAIAAKNDAVRGADAKYEDFLSSLFRKFDDFKKKDFPNRSPISLHDKFKEIRQDCGHFTSMMCKIQDPNTPGYTPPPSGTTQSEDGDQSKVPTFIH